MVICRGHIETSKGGLQFFFVVNGSMEKLTFKSNFALLSLFEVEFERVVNIRRSKIISLVNLTMVYGDPVQKQEIFYIRPT